MDTNALGWEIRYWENEESLFIGFQVLSKIKIKDIFWDKGKEVAVNGLANEYKKELSVILN